MKQGTKKIVFITTALGRGGAEVLLFELSKRLVAQGHKVLVATVVGGGEMRNEFEAADIPVRSFEKKGKLGLGVLISLIQFLKQEKPDIVHTHLFAGDTWGRIAAILTGVPTIISTEHNINVDEGRIKHIIKRLLSRITNTIIVISEQVRMYSEKVVGVAPGKLELVYNGIDLKKFSFRRTHEYFLDGNVKAVVVGQLREQKGHIYLLEAFRDIVFSYPKASLDIIGGGIREKLLREKVEELGISNNVRFLGSKPVNATVLSNYDLFFFPSLWEGLGIAILEAQAVGVPVLASKVGGIKELIIDKKTGIFFEPQNVRSIVEAARWAIEHSDQLPAITAAARKQVEDRFSMKSMVDGYLEVYERATK